MSFMDDPKCPSSGVFFVSRRSLNMTDLLKIGKNDRYDQNTIFVDDRCFTWINENVPKCTPHSGQKWKNSAFKQKMQFAFLAIMMLVCIYQQLISQISA